MTDLIQALAKMQLLATTKPKWTPDDFDPDFTASTKEAIATILNAAASGELVPLADRKLVVALVVEKAAEAVPSGWTGLPHQSNMDYGPNVSIVAKRKILALADTDAWAKLQALRAELIEARKSHDVDQKAYLSAWRRTEAAEAELAATQAKLAAVKSREEEMTRLLKQHYQFQGGTDLPPAKFNRLMKQTEAALEGAKPSPCPYPEAYDRGECCGGLCNMNNDQEDRP